MTIATTDETRCGSLLVRLLGRDETACRVGAYTTNPRATDTKPAESNFSWGYSIYHEVVRPKVQERRRLRSRAIGRRNPSKRAAVGRGVQRWLTALKHECDQGVI